MSLLASGLMAASAPPRVAPTSLGTATSARTTSSPRTLVVVCSSRPQKKATAHHMKTRPRKSQPYDIRRKPAQYPPLPSLPPDWTLVTEEPEPQEPQAEALPPL